MAIQFSGAIQIQTFSGASINSILDGIKNGLTAGGWTRVKNRFRAQNVYTNEPFFFNSFDGEVRTIGGTAYTFLNHALGCPTVQIEAGAPATVFNWGQQVNTCDPVFYSPFAGQVTAQTDPRAPAYLYLVAQQDGTAANNLPCTLQSANFGTWNSGVTYGGGWEMLSVATPQGLQMRVQVICDFIFGVGLVPHIYISSALGDVVSQPIILNVQNVTYTIVAGPYQFFISVNGNADAFTSASGGTPYLYPITAPLVISSVVAPLNGPLTCQTSQPHGLVNGPNGTGPIIQIFEAQETMGVNGSNVSSLPSALGNTFLQAGSDFQNGDVITLTGSGSATDGGFVIHNVIPFNAPVGQVPGFTLDNTLGINGLTGTIVGPAHSINGTWQVTVIDTTHFSLNGAVGTGILYVANSGLVAESGHIARCIWAFGSSGNYTNLRINLSSSNGNAQFITVNGASYNQLDGYDDPATPRFVFPGLAGQALNYSNGCAMLMEPLLAAGLDGATGQALVLGQLWDAALVTGAFLPDQTSSVDSHTFSAYSNDTGGEFPAIKQGSLWIVY